MLIRGDRRQERTCRGRHRTDANGRRHLSANILECAELVGAAADVRIREHLLVFLNKPITSWGQTSFSGSPMFLSEPHVSRASRTRSPSLEADRRPNSEEKEKRFEFEKCQNFYCFGRVTVVRAMQGCQWNLHRRLRHPSRFRLPRSR
jgi:hypothetical protein